MRIKKLKNEYFNIKMSNIYLHTKPKMYCMLLYRAITRECKKMYTKLFDFALPILIISYLLFLAYILPGLHHKVIFT